ncbi:MAG: type II toxin-antitoxin system HipA family toxin [Flavobacteriales bacterium]|nr:type II toxin-antitoxin system HipA family toxin [Flavobacteriales bacterium]
MVVAEVLLWGIRVGAVAWNEAANHGVFEFEADFLKQDLDVAPLKMPLAEARNGKRIFQFPSLNPETFQGLPGLLADSLPDKFGNRLIEEWLARQGRTVQSMNPIEKLCYIGSRGMGALEFKPAIASFKDHSDTLQVNELVRLASDILHQRNSLETNFTSSNNNGVEDIIRVGTSAGGARAKAIIAYNPQTGDVRSGQAQQSEGYEHWIIKFDGVSNDLLGDPQGYGRIEYAYHLMAKECGINMMECRLLEEHGRAHFMTKRFDRVGTEKLHMQTLCGIAHFDYNMPNVYSYEQAFQVMRQLRLPYPDAEELFRRMVFNVICFNCDDHTKNVSFLMNKRGEWKLSPAYDVTYAYNPDNRWLKQHQLSVNGKRENIYRADLLKVASEMNIKKPLEIIAAVQEAVTNWNEFASTAGIPESQAAAIDRLINP